MNRVLPVSSGALCIAIACWAQAAWTDWSLSGGAQNATHTIDAMGFEWIYAVNSGNYIVKATTSGSWYFESGYPQGVNITTSARGEIWIIGTDRLVYRRVGANNWQPLASTNCAGGTFYPTGGGHINGIAVASFGSDDLVYVRGADSQSYQVFVYDYSQSYPSCWSEYPKVDFRPYDGVAGISIDYTQGAGFQPFVTTWQDRKIWRYIGYSGQWIEVGGLGGDVSVWQTTQAVAGTDGRPWFWYNSWWYPDYSWPSGEAAMNIGRVVPGGNIKRLAVTPTGRVMVNSGSSGGPIIN